MLDFNCGLFETAKISSPEHGSEGSSIQTAGKLRPFSVRYPSAQSNDTMSRYKGSGPE